MTALLAGWVGLVVVAVVLAGISVGVAALLSLVLGLLLPRLQSAPDPRLSLEVRCQPDPWAATNAMRSLSDLFDDGPDRFAPPPPKLSPTADVTIGHRRPLAVEEIVEDALRSARASAPKSDALRSVIAMGGGFAQPTAEDHEAFEAEIRDYAGLLRTWLDEVDHFFDERAAILIADVLQENSSTVDASEARASVVFPDGFARCSDLPAGSEPPETPKFPLRRSALALAMRPFAAGESVPRLDFPLSPSQSAYLAPSEDWEPQYTKRETGLEVRYPRQTIRHGETELSGDPLMVKCPNEGEFTLRWEVHAANLPNLTRGEWRIHCRTESLGDPIRSLYELQSVLRELDPDAPDEADLDAEVEA